MSAIDRGHLIYATRIPSGVLRRRALTLSSISQTVPEVSFANVIAPLRALPNGHEILGVRGIGTRPDTQLIPDATPKRRLFITDDMSRGKCHVR